MSVRTSHDAHLSVDELKDMVGSDAFSNRVLHFGASVRGTRQFWFKQKSRLVAMVDSLGLPRCFSPTVLLISSGPS